MDSLGLVFYLRVMPKRKEKPVVEQAIDATKMVEKLLVDGQRVARLAESISKMPRKKLARLAFGFLVRVLEDEEE